MHLKQSLIIAITLSVIAIGAWEFYWRSQGKTPDLDDNKHLWAIQRAKVENLSDKDVVLMGSSRVLYDIQLDEWEKATGIRPIQLANPGASPLPVFHDLVENTDFKGTTVVGVTPPLFFSTTFPEAGPWKRAQNRVDHYYDRTYAERLNHWLSLPLQKNLVFISASEEGWADDVDLKALLNNVKIGEHRRDRPAFPPFYKFEENDEDRNTRMLDKTVKDTAFARTIKDVWTAIIKGNDRPPEREATTSFFAEDAKKFIERGGNLILVRTPSTGMFKEGETKFLPRAEFYDVLVKESGARGYHYEDYEQLKNLDCPEWSHLSAEDADFFTRELVKIMLEDKAISTTKTN